MAGNSIRLCLFGCQKVMDRKGDTENDAQRFGRCRRSQYRYRLALKERKAEVGQVRRGSAHFPPALPHNSRSDLSFGLPWSPLLYSIYPVYLRETPRGL